MMTYLSFVDKFNEKTKFILSYETCFQFYTTQTLLNWRNNALPGTASAWGRRLTIAIPIALLGIVGLIESLASFFLALILSPTELCGIRLSRYLLQRSFVGVCITAHTLTYLQYANFVGNYIVDKNEQIKE